MAIKSDQIDVGVERVQVHSADNDGAHICIRVSGGCYIGNSDLTLETGFLLEKDEIFRMFVGPDEVIYAVTDDGTVRLYYIMSLNA